MFGLFQLRATCIPFEILMGGRRETFHPPHTFFFRRPFPTYFVADPHPPLTVFGLPVPRQDLKWNSPKTLPDMYER